MIRVVLALSGSLFFGGVGAFFLFVPPLLIATALIATVVLLSTGFLLSYFLGVLQPVLPTDEIDPKR